MQEIPFTKMHGLGNDFVVLDDLGQKPLLSEGLTPDVARKICDRRFGIGADQILYLRKSNSSQSDLRMEIFNADGSIAEMCGNGIRAVALYVDQLTAQRKLSYRIDTLAGIKEVRIQDKNVIVDMGVPRLGEKSFAEGEQVQVQGKAFSFFEVDVGNPHAVVYVDEVASYPVAQVGPNFETHPRFPNRTNVEFVQVVDSHTIRVRVWERGAGTTLACGTGACAAAVASIKAGKVQSPVLVDLPGGRLKISWKGSSDSIKMEGPANTVFRGVFYL